MYGLPKQSVADVVRTAKLAASLSPWRLAVFGYAHVPWFKTHQKLIDAADLPEDVRRATVPSPVDPSGELPAAGIDLEDEVARYEHARIRQALAKAGQNKRVAAELLGLKRTTLIEKLKRLERR